MCTSRGCSDWGTCDHVANRCICAPGWTGEFCDQMKFPSCNFSNNMTYLLSCNSIRRISPVSCDCLVECLKEFEICAPGSYGCEKRWTRRMKKRMFFNELTCVAYHFMTYCPMLTFLFTCLKKSYPKYPRCCVLPADRRKKPCEEN